jgi:hypothetical protein
MTALDFHQELHGMWKQRLADADRRLAAAASDKAKAQRELDLIESYLAQTRLAEAADLLDGPAQPWAFLALATDLASAPAGFIQMGVTCEPTA